MIPGEASATSMSPRNLQCATGMDVRSYLALTSQYRELVEQSGSRENCWSGATFRPYAYA